MIELLKFLLESYEHFFILGLFLAIMTLSIKVIVSSFKPIQNNYYITNYLNREELSNEIINQVGEDSKSNIL